MVSALIIDGRRVDVISTASQRVSRRTPPGWRWSAQGRPESGRQRPHRARRQPLNLQALSTLHKGKSGEKHGVRRGYGEIEIHSRRRRNSRHDRSPLWSTDRSAAAAGKSPFPGNPAPPDWRTAPSGPPRTSSRSHTASQAADFHAAREEMPVPLPGPARRMVHPTIVTSTGWGSWSARRRSSGDGPSSTSGSRSRCTSAAPLRPSGAARRSPS